MCRDSRSRFTAVGCGSYAVDLALTGRALVAGATKVGDLLDRCTAFRTGLALDPLVEDRNVSARISVQVRLGISPREFDRLVHRIDDGVIEVLLLVLPDVGHLPLGAESGSEEDILQVAVSNPGDVSLVGEKRLDRLVLAPAESIEGGLEKLGRKLLVDRGGPTMACVGMVLYLLGSKDLGASPPTYGL